MPPRAQDKVCRGIESNLIFSGMEQCDDAGESADCDSDCTVAECGDGTLNETRGEECDAGNNIVDGDGCSAVCTNEDGGGGCSLHPMDDAAARGLIGLLGLSLWLAALGIVAWGILIHVKTEKERSQ